MVHETVPAGLSDDRAASTFHDNPPLPGHNQTEWTTVEDGEEMVEKTARFRKRPGRPSQDERPGGQASVRRETAGPDDQAAKR